MNTFALSYPQQRLWFLDQLDPQNPVYNVPLSFRIRGPLNVAALEHALSGVLARHDVLRATFREVGGQPRQAVTLPAAVTIPIRDTAGEQEACRLADEAARTPFDLGTGPLVRPLLIRLSNEDHWFCLTIHHIACDGHSLGILARELSAGYRSYLDGVPAQLPELELQYPDFAQWQVGWLDGPVVDELLGHWREHLAGLPSVASIPTDHPRPPVQTYRGAHIDFDLGAGLFPQIQQLARQNSATPYVVLLAAFAVLIAAHTGEAEVVAGSPVSGRSRRELADLIGFFANTMVLRLNVSESPTFQELIARVRDEVRGAIANYELPFERLVEELHPSRDLAHNPLFQLMFSYHESDGEGLDLPGCSALTVPGDSGTAKFDVTLSVTRGRDALTARLEYSLDLFEPETAAALAARFQAILAAALASPAKPIRALPVLPAAEHDRVLRQFNDVDPGGELDRSLLLERFAAQVRRTPDAVAVASAITPEQLTYRELDERTDELARRLRARGVATGSIVGVYLDRCPDLVVVLLGILKAGAAYLPLDPTYPRQRLSFMVSNSGTALVISKGAWARDAAKLAVEVLRLDTAEPNGDQASPVPAGTRPSNMVTAQPVPVEAAVRSSMATAQPVSAEAAIGEADLAYVIYTSGSTGQPKGVMISHGNLATFLSAIDQCPLGEDEPGTWLAVTSISFDISVLELLWTLTRGYRVVVRGDEAIAGAQGAVPAKIQTQQMQFSLFYFGGDDGVPSGDRYRLLLDGARFADRNGFTSVWTPERHFHDFGGLYPNPSVLGAAVAAITERVQIRAGSVVLPLHDPLRVAEEWSVVDNLSHGRVGISVASGWQPNDFAFAPERYTDRKRIMIEGIDEVRRLWRGESVSRLTGAGAQADVRVFPRPVQAQLPVWVTSARSPDTFEEAGRLGAGLLTHLLGHSVDQLIEKIGLYRQAWRRAGHSGTGHVTLMLHTFVGPETEKVRELVREPLCRYIKSSFDLLSGLGQALGRTGDFRDLPEAELDALVHQAFDRFFDTAALLGDPEKCADMIDRLKAIGVDEVACLIDFGVDHEQVLASLEHLAETRDLSERRRAAALADEPVSTQLRRHGITHLQCTPSLAATLAEEPGAMGGLHRWLVGGEALPAVLGENLASMTRAVHNMYGPTEATVWATTHHVGTGPMSIGRPMAGYRAYIVDAHLRPTPVGVPGELLLGGPAVVVGYLGRPGLTAQRFIPDPFSAQPGARLYRTGDLVRWRSDGTLEFLGRLDHQVKIAGHRIELGEIENVLTASPEVRAAAVVVRGEGAQRDLVAYCAPATGDASRLTAHLRGLLPSYMVPSRIVFLDELPHTPNGKVDRGKLPDPVASIVEYKAPGSEIEQAIAESWADLLGKDKLGVDDNFFDSGGNSLLAVQARARLLARSVGAVSLVDIFRYPTVRTLAAALAGSSGDELTQTRQSARTRVDAMAEQARLRRERRSR